MFDEIYKILNNAINLNEQQAFKFAVDDEVKKLIVHLNTVIQLGNSGIDSEVDSLGSYSPFTVDLRSSLGLQVNHVDFKVTGEYWGSWKVDVVGNDILINVNKSRFDELVLDLKFSDTHVGLTEENISILTTRMLPKYRQFALDKMFGT